MKTISAKILQIMTAVFAILYYKDMINPLFRGDFSLFKLNESIALILFLILMLGFALSWKWEKTGGIVIIFWYIGVWINGVFIDRSGGGMDIVLGVPALYFGALMLLHWYRTSSTPKPLAQQQWKFILRILLLNYSLLYAIIIIQDIIYAPFSVFSMPYIIFPILLAIFIAGFSLSWKHELYTGMVFVIWYGLILFGRFMYPEIPQKGPFALIGIPVLFQGIFYIYIYFRYKPKQL